MPREALQEKMKGTYWKTNCSYKHHRHKVSCIVAMRGWEGYDVFTTLTLAEGEDDVYKQAVDALNTYFVLKRNRENDMYKLFPSVTSHKFYTAKKHGKELEHQYQRKKLARENWWFEAGPFSGLYQSKTYLFGKTLGISTAELLNILYIIRCIAPTTIVKQ